MKPEHEALLPKDKRQTEEHAKPFADAAVE